MEISSEIAQEIVFQMKSVLHQEINFMDSNSMIIASTDKNRIGDFHEGASTVLATKQALIIENDQIYKGSKRGINIPIELYEEVIGVIGITGERAAVEKHGAIIKKMTEILIKEDVLKDIALKNHDRSRYIINKILNLNLSPSANTTSDIFNYDYTTPHLCIIGEFSTIFNYPYQEVYRIIHSVILDPSQFIYTVIDHKLYLFVKKTNTGQLNHSLNSIAMKITSRFESPFHFGIGPESHSLSSANQSFDYASNALYWNKGHTKKPYLHFDEMELGLLVTSIDDSRKSLISQKFLQSIPEKEYDGFYYAKIIKSI